MSNSNSAQFIQPPNTLRLKVGGGRFGGIDPNAIAKAEEALKNLSAQFSQWLDDEITKMDAARAAVREKGYTPETAESVYLRAHDLKGLGATYEYPLITRIAASLCKMTDNAELRLKAPLFLIDAHIDAIKACVRDKIKDDGHPVGKILAEELEAKTAAHLATVK